MKPKPKQLPLFDQGDDLPLFSGTPQAARLTPFRPTPQPCQARFPAECGLCHDTGFLADGYCICQAGTRARGFCPHCKQPLKNGECIYLYCSKGDA